MLLIAVPCIRSAEDLKSPPGSPTSRKSKPISITQKPQSKLDEGSPRTNKELTLIQQLFGAKLGGMADSKSTPPSPLMRTRESSSSLSPQSDDSPPVAGAIPSAHSLEARPASSGTSSSSPLSLTTRLRSNSLTELPSFVSSSPPPSTRSLTPQRTTPRSARELEESDRVRELTSRRRDSFSKKDSPRSLISVLQGLLTSNDELSPRHLDSKELNAGEISALITHEYESMREIPQSLNPAFHMFRFYFFRINEMNKDKIEGTTELQKVREAAPACLENWLQTMFEAHKRKPTCKNILDQFWRMTISQVLMDNMGQFDKEVLQLVAHSIFFIAENHPRPIERSASFEQSALIYCHLAVRSTLPFFTDFKLWLKAAEMYLKAGKIKQIFSWKPTVLKALINLVGATPNQLNNLIAANCFLAIREQEPNLESKNEYYLLATQYFYHAGAYWECFDLMCELKAQTTYPWVKEKYKEVQEHVFTIQKNKWDLSNLVTSMIQFTLAHKEQMDLPPQLNKWISVKSQAVRLRQWHQVMRARSDEWLLDKKLKLFLFSTSMSGRPAILNCTDMQFDLWLEDLLEINHHP